MSLTETPSQNDAATPSDIVSDERERFRVVVPDSQTELVLGMHDTGFVGVVARVERGGVFVGAGGGFLAGQTSYTAFRKTSNGITAGIGATIAVANIAKAALFWDQTSRINVVFSAVDLAFQSYVTSQTISKEGMNWSPGAVSVYGDTSVSLVAPLSVSSASAGFASVTAGVKASLTSPLLASVFGGLKAEIGSLYASSLLSYSSSVVGGARAALSARQGTVVVEGATVEIGSLSKAKGVARAASLIAAEQAATSSVTVRAEEEILLSPGERPSRVGSPTKIRATPGRIRAETESARLTLDERAGAGSLVCGQSGVLVSDTGIRLFRAPAPLKELIDKVVDGAIEAAEIARDAAYTAAETIEAAGTNTLVTAVSAFVGAHVGGITGAVAGSGAGAAGGVGAGAAAAGLGAFSVQKALAAVVAGKAKQAMKEQADKVYRKAVELALSTEAKTIASAGNGPLPKIDVTDTSIELSVGLSKITIGPAGIEIKTAPGATVTVNGNPFSGGLAPAMQVLA